MLGWGRSDDTVAGLLGKIQREDAALRKLPSRTVTCLAPGLIGGVVAGLAGLAVGAYVGEQLSDPMNPGMEIPNVVGGSAIGATAGCISGSAAGVVVGAADHRRTIARHRVRVNDLIRRVNHVIASQP